MNVCKNWWLVLSLGVFLTGCGSAKEEGQLDVYPASGTITIPGMDVSGLSVVFVPQDTKNTNAWTKLEPEGKFTVSTYDPGDGASIGQYKVLISGGEGPMPDDDPRMAKIPAKYKSQQDTPWLIEVTSDTAFNVYELKVE